MQKIVWVNECDEKIIHSTIELSLQPFHTNKECVFSLLEKARFSLVSNK